MQISKAGEAVGAVVDDVDVTKLSDDQFAEIRAAFRDHGALFFRDQKLTPEAHIAFAQLNIGGGWHTDHSYDEAPAMGSILYALEIPPSGGDTLFAGMAAAYAALDDEMKARVENLQARHGNAHVFGEESEYRKAIGDRYTNADQAGQTAIHPVVLTHPESGVKGLYVNPGFTLEIVDMAQEESMALLRQLYEHIQQDRFHYRHKWREGDLAMWDNRSTWHYALNDYQGHRRYLNRITIEGVALA